MKNYLIISITMGLVCACGVKEDKKNSSAAATTAASIISDSNVSIQSSQSIIDDGLEALADASISTSSSASALALTSTTTPRDVDTSATKSRVCSVQNNDAVVNITQSVNRVNQRSNLRRSVDITVTGTNNITRTWSNPNVALACNASNTAVSIDWTQDLSGLNLVATIDRSLTRSTAITIGKLSSTIANTVAATGTRTVAWTSYQSDATAGTYTEVKTIQSNVVRSLSLTSGNTTQNLKLTVVTAEGSPLHVTVVRELTSKALKTKTINSGVLVATRDGDGRIETTFDNLQLDLTGGNCQAVSGSATIAFYEAGSQTPTKTLSFVAQADGDPIVTNQTTNEQVTNFAITPCSVVELNY